MLTIVIRLCLQALVIIRYTYFILFLFCYYNSRSPSTTKVWFYKNINNCLCNNNGFRNKKNKIHILQRDIVYIDENARN